MMEIESSTMGRKSISVAKKLEIVQKANETGNVKVLLKRTRYNQSKCAIGEVKYDN